MKAVILSGGKGIRLETREFISKALIPVNGLPLIYYIFKYLCFYGITRVIMCVDINSEESINSFLSDNNNSKFVKDILSRLDISIITGKDARTGSLLYSVKDMLADDDFLVTYNDTITDVNLSQMIKIHREKGKIITVLGVHPTIRHGVISHKDDLVTGYDVNKTTASTIKGGYFVCRPEIFDYLSKESVLEEEPFQKLIEEREIVVFDHHGFWKQFDSYKHVEEMEKLFKEENSSWLIQ